MKVCPGCAAKCSKIVELENRALHLGFLVISLVHGDEVRKLLSDGVRSCKPRYYWRYTVVDLVVELACKSVVEGAGPWASRIPCPLCCCTPYDAARDGYTLPEGLHRHLSGSHNAQRCEVLEVAEQLAKR